MVMLVFIAINQQIIFTTDDSDSDVGMVKIEQPAKYLNYNIFSLNYFFLTLIERRGFSVLTISSSISILAFTLNYKNKLCIIKNHSPPINIFV
jgi:hypothetical protein